MMHPKRRRVRHKPLRIGKQASLETFAVAAATLPPHPEPRCASPGLKSLRKNAYLSLIGALFGLFLSFVEDIWGVFIGFYAPVPPF